MKRFKMQQKEGQAAKWQYIPLHYKANCNQNTFSKRYPKRIYETVAFPLTFSHLMHVLAYSVQNFSVKERLKSYKIASLLSVFLVSSILYVLSLFSTSGRQGMYIRFQRDKGPSTTEKSTHQKS